jgi:glycosyltransferase involved in cell wall biosynthesis
MVASCSPEELRRIGDASMAWVRENYDWDAVTTEYEQLFREISAR